MRLQAKMPYRLSHGLRFFAQAREFIDEGVIRSSNRRFYTERVAAPLGCMRIPEGDMRRSFFLAVMLVASIAPGGEPWDEPGAPAGEAACARMMCSPDFDEREAGNDLAARLPAGSSLLLLDWARRTDDPEARHRLLRAAEEVFDRSVLPLDERWRGVRGWIGVESRSNADARARYEECYDDPEERERDPRPIRGRMLTEVFPVTPADGAGLRPRDVVVSVDGRAPVSFLWPGGEGFPEGVTRRLRVFRPRGPEGGWDGASPDGGEYVAEGAEGEWLDVEVTGEARPWSARRPDLEALVREDALRAWFGLPAAEDGIPKRRGIEEEG